MKKPQIYWAPLIGLITVVIQNAIYYMRFGKWNTFFTMLDFILFFIAGTLGGLVLFYFLNRQSSKTARTVTIISFLLASPIAMFMMIGGGLLGAIGVIIFPLIPWTLFTWIGGLVGNFFAKK